jgi:hypothetical protein
VNIDVVASDELEAQRIRSRCGAMLDREQHGVLLSAEVEIGFAPGVKVTAAAERQAGLGAGTAVLLCAVHDEDGDVMLALQGAEVAEQGGDLAGVILVDAVETDEGVEHEQAGREPADSGAQAAWSRP